MYILYLTFAASAVMISATNESQTALIRQGTKIQKVLKNLNVCLKLKSENAHSEEGP